MTSAGLAGQQAGQAIVINIGILSIRLSLSRCTKDVQEVTIRIDNITAGRCSGKITYKIAAKSATTGIPNIRCTVYLSPVQNISEVYYQADYLTFKAWSLVTNSLAGQSRSGWH